MLQMKYSGAIDNIATKEWVPKNLVLLSFLTSHT